MCQKRNLYFIRRTEGAKRMFGTVTRYDNQKGYGFIRKKEGLISQPLMVYNLLRKVVGGENSDLPSVRLEKK